MAGRQLALYKDHQDRHKQFFWEVAATYRSSTRAALLPVPLTTYDVIAPVFTQPSLLTTNHTLPIRHTIAAVWKEIKRRCNPKPLFFLVRVRLTRQNLRRFPQRQFVEVVTMEDGTSMLVGKSHAPAWRANRPAWDRHEPVQYTVPLRIAAGDEA